MIVGIPVLLTASPVVDGAPGSIEGVLQWASSDPSIATVEASPDGLTARALGISPGSVTFTATEPPRSDGTASASGSYATTVAPAPLPHATGITITEGPLP